MVRFPPAARHAAGTLGGGHLMIEYLRGQLLSTSGNHLVIDVGGVGYGVTVPASAAEALGAPGVGVQVWVRTWVREDMLQLYGFRQLHERDFFDELTAVSGVGPSMALALMSALSAGEILQAVLASDISRFKRVKGIGQRMAEKLVMELRRRADRLAAGLPASERGVSGAAGEEPAPAGEAAREAVMALEALDVRPAQARRAIALALEALGPDATTEQLVREGLKHRRG